VILAGVAVTAVVWYRAATAVYEIGGSERPLSSCQVRLRGIASAMMVYANEDPNHRLPPADKWCDLLLQWDYTLPKQYVCYGSGAVEGESSYAINKHIAGKSLSDIPQDVVLLFETDHGIDPNGRNELAKNRQFYDIMPSYVKGETKVFKNRWNQSGGSEILTTQHHNGKGCNVVFMDAHVQFVKTKDLGKLKWAAPVSKSDN